MDYSIISPGRILGALILVLLQPLGANAALPAYTAPQHGQMRAHFVNVGQGSSVLLEFSCAAALIDTGGEKNDQFDSVKSLQDYLDAFFARRTDLKKTLSLVLITHAHIDHTRGLPMVLRRYSVHSYVDNGAETGSGGRQQKTAHAKANASGSDMSWEAVTEADITGRSGLTSKVISPIKCTGDDIAFHVLWGGLRKSDGWTATVFGNQNDWSAVTRLDFGKTSFLFMGDLEEDVHQSMIGVICGQSATTCPTLQTDVYQLAHHGSYNGTSEPLVKAVTPKMAVIAMGPPDREALWTAVAYGHPRKVAVDMIDDALTGTRPGIDAEVATKAGSTGTASQGEFVHETISKPLYATGWDGTVVITADANHNLHVDVEGKH